MYRKINEVEGEVRILEEEGTGRSLSRVGEGRVDNATGERKGNRRFIYLGTVPPPEWVRESPHKLHEHVEPALSAGPLGFLAGGWLPLPPPAPFLPRPPPPTREAAGQGPQEDMGTPAPGSGRGRGHRVTVPRRNKNLPGLKARLAPQYNGEGWG